jgi:hypothetical protein
MEHCIFIRSRQAVCHHLVKHPHRWTYRAEPYRERIRVLGALEPSKQCTIGFGNKANFRPDNSGVPWTKKCLRAVLSRTTRHPASSSRLYSDDFWRDIPASRIRHNRAILLGLCTANVITQRCELRVEVVVVGCPTVALPDGFEDRPSTLTKTTVQQTEPTATTPPHQQNNHEVHSPLYPRLGPDCVARRRFLSRSL